MGRQLLAAQLHLTHRGPEQAVARRLQPKDCFDEAVHHAHISDRALKLLRQLRLQRQNQQHVGDGSRGSVVAGDQQRTDARHLFRERSEEHTSELQSLMRISYAVFCLKKKKKNKRSKTKHFILNNKHTQSYNNTRLT